MLEKVVLKTENSWDDVFGLGEEIEVTHFIWMATGAHHIVHIQGCQPVLLYGCKIQKVKSKQHIST